VQVKVLKYTTKGDNRGSLIALEENSTIPFGVKRVYYIFNTRKNERRGYHAHINLKQVAICVKGSCKFLIDDGCERQTILLDSPEKGLLIEGLVWREMYDFSSDCVLLVLASELYDEDDYIRDYQKFMDIVNEIK